MIIKTELKFNQMNGTPAVSNPANVRPQHYIIIPNRAADVMPVAGNIC